MKATKNFIFQSMSEYIPKPFRNMLGIILTSSDAEWMAGSQCARVHYSCQNAVDSIRHAVIEYKPYSLAHKVENAGNIM